MNRWKRSRRRSSPTREVALPYRSTGKRREMMGAADRLPLPEVAVADLSNCSVNICFEQQRLRPTWARIVAAARYGQRRSVRFGQPRRKKWRKSDGRCAGTSNEEPGGSEKAAGRGLWAHGKAKRTLGSRSSEARSS